MLRKLILKPNRPPITSPSLIRLFSEELNLTPPTCYYKTLNLSTNATFDSIKSSYLSLAKKYHPDISQAPNSKEKFQQVAEAYKMLSKPENRQKYDFSIGIKQPKWHFDENLEDEFENQEEFMKYVKGEKDFENEKYNIDYSFEEEKSEELYDYFRYKYLGRFREKKGEVGELSKFRDMVDEANTVDERNPLKFSPKIKEKWEEVKKERIEKNVSCFLFIVWVWIFVNNFVDFLKIVNNFWKFVGIF
jgi:curved DNA-binding protein CbpA